jgi:hypothetical protein
MAVRYASRSFFQFPLICFGSQRDIRMARRVGELSTAVRDGYKLTLLRLE